jgi:hypothetical protein
MKVVQTILIVIACLVLVVGTNIASGVPGQIYFVSLACFFLIMARLSQASAHQEELVALNNNLLKNKSEFDNNSSNQEAETKKTVKVKKQKKTKVKPIYSPEILDLIDTLKKDEIIIQYKDNEKIEVISKASYESDKELHLTDKYKLIYKK